MGEWVFSRLASMFLWEVEALLMSVFRENVSARNLFGPVAFSYCCSGLRLYALLQGVFMKLTNSLRGGGFGF